MKRDAVLVIVAAAAGAAVWVAVAKLGGRREAWDSGLYWALAMPSMMVLSGVLAWIAPRKAWRWAVVPFIGQFVAMVAMAGGGGLWPLGLALMLVLSLPSLAVVLVVSARRLR